jgi:hypothetical protein
VVRVRVSGFGFGFGFGFRFRFRSGSGSGSVFGCVQRPVGYSTYCDEFGVRLTVIRASDRVRYEPTFGCVFALVPLAVGSGSPRGSVGTPADGVLLSRAGGDDV